LTALLVLACVSEGTIGEGPVTSTDLAPIDYWTDTVAQCGLNDAPVTLSYSGWDDASQACGEAIDGDFGADPADFKDFQDALHQLHQAGLFLASWESAAWDELAVGDYLRQPFIDALSQAPQDWSVQQALYNYVADRIDRTIYAYPTGSFDASFDWETGTLSVPEDGWPFDALALAALMVHMARHADTQTGHVACDDGVEACDADWSGPLGFEAGAAYAWWLHLPQEADDWHPWQSAAEDALARARRGILVD